jgi:hypothetical protein
MCSLKYFECSLSFECIVTKEFVVVLDLYKETN